MNAPAKTFLVEMKAVGGPELKKTLADAGVDFDRLFQKVERGGRQAGAGLGALDRGVQASQTMLGGLMAKLGPIGTALGGVARVAGPVGGAIAAIAVALRPAVQAASEFERSWFKLNAVLAATGQSSGKTASDIEALAQSIGTSTLANVNQVRAAATQLLTFRSIAGDTFDQTLRLAQDLAAVGFGTLESATVQLGKALEDPVQGVSALKEVGISFSAAQREMIKSLVETGDKAAAMSVILGVVKEQVGGAGTAEAGGLAGAVDNLGDSWRLMLEQIGEYGIIDAVTWSVNGLRSAVDGLRDLFDGTTLGDWKDELVEAQQTLANLQKGLNDTVTDGATAAALEKSIERQKQEVAAIETKIAALEKEAGAERELAAARAGRARVQAQFDADSAKLDEILRRQNEERERAAQRAEQQAANEANRRKTSIETLMREVEELQRLNAAKRMSAEAAQEVADQIEIENAVRELGTGATREQIDTLTELIRKKQEERRESEELVKQQDEERRAREEFDRFLTDVINGIDERRRKRDEQMQRLLEEPMLDFMRNTRSLARDFWADFTDGGIDSWSDIGRAGKRVIQGLVAEWLTNLTFNPGWFANQAQGGSSGTSGQSGTNVSFMPSGLSRWWDTGSFLGPKTTASVNAWGANNLGFQNLSNYLSGAGLGFGVGSVNLFGGNRTGSKIGGTIGGAAGAIFGPLGQIGGSLLGSLVGGLFGNSQPSNKAAGGEIDLDTFRSLTSTAAGKKASEENQTAVASALSTLGDLAKQLETLTGGDLRGKLSIVVGDRDGVTVSFGDLSRTFTGDKQAAVEQAVQFLTDSMLGGLEGVGPQVQKLLDDGVGRPIEETLAKLQDFSAFKTVYDGLFVMEKQLTPLEATVEQMSDALAAAKPKAEQFGFSVEELTKRMSAAITQLRNDFDADIADRIRRLQNPGLVGAYDLDKELESLLRDATAVGGDRGQVFRWFDLAFAQLVDPVLEAEEDLQQTRLQGTRDTARAMGQALRQAARDLIATADDLFFDTGLSQVSPLDRFNAALTQFRGLAGGERTATTAASLRNAASVLAKLNEDFYGATPQGVALFNEIQDTLRGWGSSLDDSGLAQERTATAAEAILELLQKGAANQNGVRGEDPMARFNQLQGLFEQFEGSLVRRGGSQEDVYGSETVRQISDEMAKVYGRITDTGFLTVRANELRGAAASDDILARQGLASSQYAAIAARLRELGVPGFATGGSFTVGGNGGTDSSFVAFRATPGERVTVAPPGQGDAWNSVRADLRTLANVQVASGGQLAELLASIDRRLAQIERDGQLLRSRPAA